MAACMMWILPDNMPPVICILGPTASGKTDLALALAEHYPVHLISVDSAQIYRGMNIGTAKPDNLTLQRYPHALIDILEPEESYSAGRFAADARDEIESAHANGQIPVLVGGTMLYYLTLYSGLDKLPAADPANRAHIEARLAAEGHAALHAELLRCDPQTAATIAMNDSQRLVRALELILTTGQTPSALYAAQQKNTPTWRTLAIGLHVERALLHQRIADRFHNMIAAGFIEEVEALKKRPHLSLAAPSMRSVGYRQIWQYLDGEYDRDSAIEQGIIASRQLAKRQITWMNNRLASVLPLTIQPALAPLNTQLQTIM
ncbi:MAG: tRNA (adenosine(37)-N6)-dimethylallyltransferase MiaA, partial [Cardiobacteriaceae bacterium]|nr:tRNA (adenosine(37)-N6)-dimethylallyltransferase MiaA [Cardiobacteriaceae bacterium]